MFANFGHPQQNSSRFVCSAWQIAREKMDAHTQFQIRQGEHAARLSQMSAEKQLEEEYVQLADRLVTISDSGE